jgi:Protein of unknown function (DUF2950)
MVQDVGKVMIEANLGSQVEQTADFQAIGCETDNVGAFAVEQLHQIVERSGFAGSGLSNNEKRSGQWFFDTAAGKEEILARRIGNGELSAMAALQAIADAQKQYFNQTHDGVKQYAQKFVSDEGKHNGLYWPVQEGQPQSPLGPAAEMAKVLGYTTSGDKPQPFNGYYFKILTKQGDSAKGGAKDYIVDGKMTRGFAVLAYPARYRDSGIMTFIMDQGGVLYQKDLGEKTDDEGATMVAYNPRDGWQSVTGVANPTQANASSSQTNEAARHAGPAS